ncbi:MAG: filamentous hemagglutinin N-terminal domain-containing protein, partial [Burkholderiales bacterium]
MAGNASFSQQGNVLDITNSAGAIIHWQSFSIDAGETTRFIQQSASSAVLNRVVGQDPSSILGSLLSNGRVFLINPNGIVFSRGAVIDVAGLVASTLNISGDDFLKGNLSFNGSPAGGIVNQGTITTPSGGSVYLIAPDIENSGVIASPHGEVILAAGSSIHLADAALPELQVEVQAPQDQVINLGSLVAHSGSIGIYAGLIDQQGRVSADSAVIGENGKIVFKASRDITLAAGSSTSANG